MPWGQGGINLDDLSTGTKELSNKTTRHADSVSENKQTGNYALHSLPLFPMSP